MDWLSRQQRFDKKETETFKFNPNSYVLVCLGSDLYLGAVYIAAYPSDRFIFLKDDLGMSLGASGRSLACCPIAMFCGTQATAAVLDHLTDEKRKHSHMLWVNLQEELVLEGNGQMFTPREPSCLDQHISIPSSDPQLIEVNAF